jgi:YVTN family beta-propeller protein
MGVAANPITNRIYVANSSSSSVSVINGATNSVITAVTVGVKPFGVAVIFQLEQDIVSNITSNTVSVISGLANAVYRYDCGWPVPKDRGQSCNEPHLCGKYSEQHRFCNRWNSDIVIATVAVGTGPQAWQ